MTITGKSSFSGTHYWRAWKAGQVYNGSAYEDYLLANYATYDIAAVDKGLGNFTGTIPDDADFGELVYQAGGSPAATDGAVWVLDSGELRTLLALPASAAGGASGIPKNGAEWLPSKLTIDESFTIEGVSPLPSVAAGESGGLMILGVNNGDLFLNDVSVQLLGIADITTTTGTVRANIVQVGGQTATATGAVDFDDLGTASAGDATAANQALILAQVNKITTGRTQYISHVHETDVTINQGETYSASLNPLTFTFASGDSWPTDLTSYTITLIATQTHDTQGNTPTSPASISQAGSVATATGDSRAVRIDFTAAQSAALTPGLYEYYLKASTGSGGSTVDWLRQGQLRVVDATP